jgi:hypothetical protein
MMFSIQTTKIFFDTENIAKRKLLFEMFGLYIFFVVKDKIAFSFMLSFK